MSTDTRIDAIAERILQARATRVQIPPITAADPAFGLTDAYAVSAAITRRRVAAGEHPVGWKIGFTNRTIWDEYGVHAPIWGPVYDTTRQVIDPAETIDCDLSELVEPRLEPEIVFRIGRSPEPGEEGAALLACLDGVTHGCEIVQSVYPNWAFKAADTVAAFALHGRLYHGPFRPIDETWLARLATFEIVLSRDGIVADRGTGANVLGSPLAALAHFVRGLAEMSGERLKAGDVVTTGTVTRAFPMKPGETWSSEVIGLPLDGLALRFR
jgi:2-oxo-3-hexenedioate decarboxylase